MILKGFKEKSIKKHINKLLSKRHVNVSDTKVESLGIIFNLDEVDDFEQFSALSSYLKVLPNRLKLIAFSSNKKDTLKSWDVCFNPNDFGWNGAIKNSELQTFLDTKFDVLISYYEAEVTELKLLTVLSKAQLKVGILQTDERINDLIIKTNLTEFNVFKTEVFKYLTILNKIKNE
ncbi:hypothetical protein CJ739_4058 [Mariniflexile rhizosphaerae]|uniref:DUF6913 domain-containing protein n=1 Tax=unclassified Mariniflexile TaxID=2643887 RepID=UPI000CC5C9BA|nr:hypothetical protein [Mariniflexile sp. TRM1-10]AXP83116.1 hypothetical protein CJ739_4058 [Mariniflexile sp. TRM1-10]PLB18665.1 MAG: hypothetical protein TRG1_2486 [Flavobacteriaceae bacterium FS1-H7996/R]